MRFFLLRFVALFLLSLPACAQSPLQIPRANRPPVLADYVGGVPNDAGLKIHEFRQRTPGDGQSATKPTEAYLSHDDTHFYAVFVAHDAPDGVRARVARREDFNSDDFVILELDTLHDKRSSFVFFVNPYGVQFDAKRSEGQDFDVDFDTQWESDGQLTEDGYVVSIAIPFKSLRFKSGASQDWGIAVGRQIARLNEASYWPHISKTVAGFVPQFATVQIPAAVSPGRNIQIIPFLYGDSSRTLNTDRPSGAPWDDSNERRSGVDAKFVVNDSIAIDLTLRPDFSEVESDEPQVLVDKRFEVLFPEKRPFFLENSSVFATPQPLFFSRRISDPSYGARVTGRLGHWSFGSLLINDAAPGKQLASTAPAFGQTANIAVARVLHDVSTETYFGLMLTRQELGPLDHTVGGVDFTHRLTPNWTLSGQYAESQTHGDAQGKNTGQLSFLQAAGADRNFTYSGRLLSISPQFDTTLAFIPRTDIRQTTHNAGYLWHQAEGTWIQSHGPTLAASLTRNHDNALQDWSADAGWLINAPASTTVEAHRIQSYERFAGLDFYKMGYLFNLTTDWWSWLSVAASYGQSDAVNYQPAVGMLPLLGNARTGSIAVKLSPLPKLRIEESLLWNDLRTQSSSLGASADTSVYRDLISRTKISYQHNRFAAVRLILDYSDLSADPRLTSLKGGKQLNTDLQFSYRLNPGTTFYAGYVDRRENIRLVGNPNQVQVTDDLTMQTGRKLFVKMSYLFQL